jgi:hypothetical protein
MEGILLDIPIGVKPIHGNPFMGTGFLRFSAAEPPIRAKNYSAEPSKKRRHPHRVPARAYRRYSSLLLEPSLLGELVELHRRNVEGFLHVFPFADEGELTADHLDHLR